MAKRKTRYRRDRASLSKSLDDAGWTSSAIAHVRPGAAAAAVDRGATPIKAFDALRVSLRDLPCFVDLTCGKTARGIVHLTPEFAVAI